MFSLQKHLLEGRSGAVGGDQGGKEKKPRIWEPIGIGWILALLEVLDDPSFKFYFSLR